MLRPSWTKLSEISIICRLSSPTEAAAQRWIFSTSPRKTRAIHMNVSVTAFAHWYFPLASAHITRGEPQRIYHHHSAICYSTHGTHLGQLLSVTQLMPLHGRRRHGSFWFGSVCGSAATTQHRIARAVYSLLHCWTGFWWCLCLQAPRENNDDALLLSWCGSSINPAAYIC